MFLINTVLFKSSRLWYPAHTPSPPINRLPAVPLGSSLCVN